MTAWPLLLPAEEHTTFERVVMLQRLSGIPLRSSSTVSQVCSLHKTPAMGYRFCVREMREGGEGCRWRFTSTNNSRYVVRVLGRVGQTRYQSKEGCPTRQQFLALDATTCLAPRCEVGFECRPAAMAPSYDGFPSLSPMRCDGLTGH